MCEYFDKEYERLLIIFNCIKNIVKEEKIQIKTILFTIKPKKI